MATFIFTYGLDGQPYKGGWTEIEAEDCKTACALFRLAHPDRTDGLLNCSWVYTEEDFARTRMAKEGNFGVFCRERIRMNVEVTS